MRNLLSGFMGVGKLFYGVFRILLKQLGGISVENFANWPLELSIFMMVKVELLIAGITHERLVNN